MPPAKQYARIIEVRLSAAQLNAVDQAAARYGLTRSDVIRDCVQQVLLTPPQVGKAG